MSDKEYIWRSQELKSSRDKGLHAAVNESTRQRVAFRMDFFNSLNYITTLLNHYITPRRVDTEITSYRPLNFHRYHLFRLARYIKCTATKAAVSVRNLLRPKLMGWNPALMAICTSSILKSPSGPIITNVCPSV